MHPQLLPSKTPFLTPAIMQLYQMLRRIITSRFDVRSFLQLTNVAGLESLPLSGISVPVSRWHAVAMTDCPALRPSTEQFDGRLGHQFTLMPSAGQVDFRRLPRTVSRRYRGCAVR
jgi:hypothetical protein